MELKTRVSSTLWPNQPKNALGTRRKINSQIGEARSRSEAFPLQYWRFAHKISARIARKLTAIFRHSRSDPIRYAKQSDQAIS